MKISLSAWKHPKDGSARVYINGTKRDHNGLYVTEGGDGRWYVSSRTIDRPARRQASTVYTKRQKDTAAAIDALNRLGINTATPFARILDIAEGRAPLIQID